MNHSVFVGQLLSALMIPPLFMRFANDTYTHGTVVVTTGKRCSNRETSNKKRRRDKNRGYQTNRRGAVPVTTRWKLERGGEGMATHITDSSFLDDALENAMFLAPANFPPRSFVWQTMWIMPRNESSLSSERRLTTFIFVSSYISVDLSTSLTLSLALLLFILRSSGVQFPLLVSIHSSNGNGGIEREKKRPSLLSSSRPSNPPSHYLKRSERSY